MPVRPFLKIVGYYSHYQRLCLHFHKPNMQLSIMEERNRVFVFEFKHLHFCLLKTISKGSGLPSDLVVLGNILNIIFETVLLQLIKNGIESIKVLEIAFLHLGYLFVEVSCLSYSSIIKRGLKRK